MMTKITYLVRQCFYLLILAAAVSCLGQTLLKTCDQSKCSGEYKLSIPIEPSITVDVTKAKGVLYEYPAVVDIITARRRKLTIKCEADFPPFKNGKCEEKVAFVNPTTDEMRTNYRSKKCPVGWECAPEGDCFGDLQSRCDTNELIRDIGESYLKWKGRRYKKWLRDTCVSSWECINEKTTVATSIKKEENNMKPILVTTNKLGETIEINEEFHDSGKSDMEGNIQTVMRMPKDPPGIPVSLKCYTGSESEVMCMVLSSSTIKNIPISITNDLTGLIRNFFLVVTSNITVIKDGKVREVSREITQSGTTQRKWVNPQLATNIETVNEIVDSIKTLQVQTIYNVQHNEINIDRLLKIIKELVKSSSRIDSMLISRLVANHFESRWINDDVFELCPCKKVNPAVFSNCFGNMIYHSGAYRTKGPDDTCLSFDEASVKNVSIFDYQQLDIQQLKNLPPQTSMADSGAWNNLLMLDISSRMSDDQAGTEQSSGISVGVDNLPNLLLPWMNFTFVSCCVSWLTLLLLILARR